MNLTRHVLVALALGAWAASFAHADARARSIKHGANTTRHIGEPHRPAGGVAVRANASPRAPVAGRNAIGLATPPAGAGPGAAGRGATAAGAVKPNAIGVHVNPAGMTPSVPAGAGKIAPAASPAIGIRAAAPALPAQAHGGTISGTGITRPGIAPGAIGGPAKVAVGISGTGMKPKR